MNFEDQEYFRHDRIRLEIARRIVERKKQELGEHLVAAACYGSVAHHASMEYSDIELIILTDDAIEAREDMFFDDGIMVECDILPAARMLKAAQLVRASWGIEADQYLYHLVLWDPDQFFPRLWATARNLPAEDFERALKTSWWREYEIRTKALNAQVLADRTRLCAHGWDFAKAAAMHIALYERKPYESGRTLWQDVTARGYGMKELVDALTTGNIQQIPSAIDNVWKQTKTWGAPEGQEE
jgi:hypothetical protein